MITDDRKDEIAGVLVLSYDFEMEEAQKAVSEYVDENPQDIDEEVSNEEAAALINEYTD